MKKLILASIAMFAFGCATPRVWTISQDENGGVIGYQNYNPAKDQGKKFKRFLKCENHTMTANPIKTGYSAPTAYQAYNNGYGMTTIYPLDGGNYEWAEYHYRCNGSKNSAK